MNKSGTLFVVAAPSGAGKTSLVRGVVESLENIRVSVSHTTRAPRPDDQDGVDYFYITDDDFSNLSDLIWIESASKIAILILVPLLLVGHEEEKRTSDDVGCEEEDSLVHITRELEAPLLTHHRD